jgi:heme exporter protein A
MSMQDSQPADSHVAPAIVADGLGKSFGTRKALDSLSFVLPRGGFCSVFGPNGAGKSTLLRLLATLSRPSSGKAQVLGHDLKDDADQIRASIGLIAHRSMLYLDLTAEQNLLYYARLYGVEDPRGRVGELLGLVDLTARRHDTLRGFSRGMTQRMAIARALVHDPDLLLMDEPYSGLDPRAAAVFDSLLEQIRPGKSFLMVSHDLIGGFVLASHLLVLASGRQALFAEAATLDAQGFSDLYLQAVSECQR